MKKLLFFALLSCNLFAIDFLHDNYYIKSDVIKISDIIEGSDNTILYKISEGRYTKRVKTKNLLLLLKKHGYKEYKADHAYVKFIKKSPINVSKIKNYIKKYYEQKYPHIAIEDVDVKSRGYVKALPAEYTLKMQSKSYLRNSGTMHIETLSNKEIYFDYYIKATLNIYAARVKIQKGKELSQLNLKKKKIVFDKFHAMPLLELKKLTLQSKHRIKAGKLLTSRDVSKLFLVKRGSNVNLFLDSTNLSISFSAKAMQNGCYGDTITVMKSDGKRLKAKVVAKHKAEVQ